MSRGALESRRHEPLGPHQHGQIVGRGQGREPNYAIVRRYFGSVVYCGALAQLTCHGVLERGHTGRVGTRSNLAVRVVGERLAAAVGEERRQNLVSSDSCR